MSNILIYTDGACSGNPGPGGYGSIIFWNDQIQELGAHQPATTNNRMEMTAVLAALDWIRQQNIQEKNLIIYTDSVYVIKGMTQWVFGWLRKGWKNSEGQEVTNQDIWRQLLAASQGFKIEWRFIRGHKGIPGNERCDQIAVAFSHKDPISLYSGSSQSYSFDIRQLPVAEPLPEFKPGSGSAEKKDSWYLSLISGKVTKYATWKECEAAVKGRPGVKFKKVSSLAEEQELLKNWGVS